MTTVLERPGDAAIGSVDTVPTDLHGHTKLSDGRAEPEHFVEFRASIGVATLTTPCSRCAEVGAMGPTGTLARLAGTLPDGNTSERRTMGSWSSASNM